MDIEFNSLKELYERLKPALNTKKREFIRNKIDYIKEEDIWNYLRDYKWKKSNNLLLYQMVDDILNTDIVLIDGYVKENLKSRVIEPNFDNLKSIRMDDDYGKEENE